MQPHDRLLPVGHLAHAEAVAALLAQVLLRTDLLDADAEKLLHRGLDLRLGRVPRHLEGVAAADGARAFLVPPRADALGAGAMVRGLLGDQPAEHDLVRPQFRPRRRQDHLALARPRFELPRVAFGSGWSSYDTSSGLSPGVWGLGPGFFPKPSGLKPQPFFCRS